MTLNLNPETEAHIAELVEAGDYPNADAAIEDAIRALDLERRSIHLMELIQVGIDQADRGELIPYSDELRQEIRESAKRRFAAGQRAAPHVRP
jgi:antitoxin ParD1/3/4